MSVLGDRIKELRNEKRISQTELGKEVGVGKTTISNYETDYSTPDNETLKKIADILLTSTDYLLGRTNIKDPIKESPSLPDEFNSPEEAIKFLLEQNVIMGFGGFDVDKLSDEEKVDFANELLGQLKLLSYKYKK